MYMWDSLNLSFVHARNSLSIFLFIHPISSSIERVSKAVHEYSLCQFVQTLPYKKMTRKLIIMVIKKLITSGWPLKLFQEHSPKKKLQEKDQNWVFFLLNERKCFILFFSNDFNFSIHYFIMSQCSVFCKQSSALLRRRVRWLKCGERDMR